MTYSDQGASPLKALSVQQPWAWLIVNGHKDVENRTWRTKLRGRILIHASKRFDDFGYSIVQRDFPRIEMPAKADFQRGGIVGSAFLWDCVDHSGSRWYRGWKGDWGFLLHDPTPLPFQPCPGKLGFFLPSIDVSEVV